MSAAATRAWYLPTCVKSATPETSPIAQTCSAARQRSSTSIPRGPVETPIDSRPRSSMFACRPVATSSRSASTVEPSDSVRRTPASTFSTATPVRTSISSSRKTSSTSAPASSWMRPSSRGPCSTTVTREPSRAKNCASSEPTGPPPSTARLSGTSCVEVASTGGIAGRDPVATTSRSYSSSCPSTSTTPGRATRASPRTKAQRCPSSQSSWPWSSQSLVTQSRHDQTPSASGCSGARPGARSSDDESSAARSIVFVGMHA